MRLEFNSFEEIEEFLRWVSKRVTSAEVAVVGDVKISPAHEAKAAAGETKAYEPEHAAICKGTNCSATDGVSHSAECIAQHEAITGQSAGVAWPYGSTPPVAASEANAGEKPRRTRRTKAEIEAAKTAEAGSDAPPVNANPFASTQAAANAAMDAQPTSNPTALAAQAHVEQLEPAAENAAPATVDASDVHARLVAKAAELGPVGATQHLQAARNFIAKFQMPKYNDSFKLADLPSDVMKYSDVQRAMHCAAMEYLSTHD